MLITMNNELGLQDVLKVRNSAIRLITVLDPTLSATSNNRKRMILNMLSALCQLNEEGFL